VAKTGTNASHNEKAINLNYKYAVTYYYLVGLCFVS